MWVLAFAFIALETKATRHFQPSIGSASIVREFDTTDTVFQKFQKLPLPVLTLTQGPCFQYRPAHDA